jgi:hypothetical protein
MPILWNDFTFHIGVLAGKDPVALDTACLDLVQKSSGEKLFEKGRTSLKHAEKIGLAFQVRDDILDVEGSFESLGKDIGSDVQKGKSTFVSILFKQVQFIISCIADHCGSSQPGAG